MSFLWCHHISQWYLYAGPLSTGCFSHQRLLLCARKLVPKKSKNSFFPSFFVFFKGSCTLLYWFYILSNFKSWYFIYCTFTHLPWYNRSMNSLIYVIYSIQIPSCILWVFDHNHDHTSSYYHHPKKFSVLPLIRISIMT